MSKKYSLYQLFASAIILLGVLLFSCQKEKLLTDSSARLNFSKDTVSFDTVYSSVNSITLRVSAINNNDGIIRIDKLQLAKGSESEFTMNVDGIDGFLHTDIDIPAHDSIIIFLRANILENGHDSIGIHQDSIEFFFNNTYQDLDVVAYGQDIHKVDNSTFIRHMSGMKPYAITNSIVIPENETLQIDEGVQLLMWPNTNIEIEGTLIINGTVDAPVYITSNNLKHYRNNAAGDWGSIIFRPTSKGNKISNCRIANGVNGLKLETDGEQSVDLKIDNTIIQSFSYASLLSEFGTVTAVNCVIGNAMQYAVLISRGGSYNFIHNTIATHQFSSERRKSLFRAASADIINKGYKKKSALDLKELTIKNSIIYSSSSDDSLLVSKDATDFNCSIEYSMLNLSNKLKEEYAQYLSNIVYYDIQSNRDIFSDEEKSPVSFMLDSLSQASDTANIEIAKQYPFDIHGTDRFADTLPDLGAYEYFYSPKEEE